MSSLNPTGRNYQFAGHYERSIFYNITTSLIAQLSSEVILDKDNYKTQIQNDPSSPANVKYGSLGIGTSSKTWYTTPDARCRSSFSTVDIIGPEKAVESPGDTSWGFKKCGVNPFNKKAILVPDSDNSSMGVEATEQSSSMTEEAVSEVDGGMTWNEELFERRYEERYDLYDPDYLPWLELHHPDAVTADRYTLTCSISALNSSPMYTMCCCVGEPSAAGPSSMDFSSSHHSTMMSPSTVMSPSSKFISSVHPFKAVSPSGLSTATSLSAVSHSHPFSAMSPSSPSTATSPSGSSTPRSLTGSSTATSRSCPSSAVSPSGLSTSASRSNSSTATSHSNPSTAMSPLGPSTVTSLSVSSTVVSQCTLVSAPEVTPLSRFLTVSKPALSAASSKNRATTGARVLTSSECLAIIEKKEIKKEHEQENELKRKEREIKKQCEEEKESLRKSKKLRKEPRMQRRRQELQQEGRSLERRKHNVHSSDHSKSM